MKTSSNIKKNNFCFRKRYLGGQIRVWAPTKYELEVAAAFITYVSSVIYVYVL